MNISQENLRLEAVHQKERADRLFVSLDHQNDVLNQSLIANKAETEKHLKLIDEQQSLIQVS